MSQEHFHLVVVHDFGTYKRGDRITDPAEVEAVHSENEHNCRRVWKPQELPVSNKTDSKKPIAA